MHLSAIPRPVALALVFAAAAGLSALTLLEGIQPNDEGLMLQAAARIADGQVPYDDFWWYYPPGQPYLLAGLWEAFGPSLLTWRIVRVLCDAAVALLVYVLARRGAGDAPGAGPPLALGAALAAALAMAYPSGPHPFPPSLVLALGALLALRRSPVLAGVLAGACAAWRIEFAAYLGLGILVAYALRPEARAAAMIRFAAAAVLVAAVLYAPVVARAGLGDSFELLVRYPLEDFGDYQSLPFPLDYDGPLDTSSLSGFLSNSAENLLEFYLPLVLMVGFAGAAAALALRFGRDQWERAAAAVFAVGMAHYLLVRPDTFHTAPLAVMVSVLAAWALAAPRSATDRRTRVPAMAAAGLAALSLAYLVVEGVDRRALGLREDNVELELGRADGVRAPAEDAGALRGVVTFIRRRVPEGRPIYVATRRSDLITSGHPLLYVLAGRENPTRYDIQAPGVVTSEPVQREIVDDLERTRTELVVRFTDPVTAVPEPNRAGRSTGVTVLDDYIEGRYRMTLRFGAFEVMERRR